MDDDGFAPWNLAWYDRNYYATFYEDPIPIDTIRESIMDTDPDELTQEALLGVPTEPMDPLLLRDLLEADEANWDLDGIPDDELLG